MQHFNELGLDPLLLKAISKEGYKIPTPIQTQVIPNVLGGRDILGIAQTGTGKTAAFALPILQKICIQDRHPPQRKGARVLILCPTRELATQIGESFRVYGNFIQLSVAVIYGGVSHKPQREKLSRGVDILIATPGRLMDHLKERNLSLDATEILVLDEADQMLDLGFIHSLRKIVSVLPHRRQSLFFSATMPHEIGALAAELLKNPIKISIHQEVKVAEDVEQKVIFVDQMQKRALLIEFFNTQDLQRAIVFTRTKRGAERVAKFLETAGIQVASIHGDKSQAQREAALQAFKNSHIRGLIATDIAARGIDIDSVSHVINYEIPNIPEIYVHRIGRTARAGAQGIAISFVDSEERSYLRDIERLTKQKIPSTDRSNDLSLKQNDPNPKRYTDPQPSKKKYPYRNRGEKTSVALGSSKKYNKFGRKSESQNLRQKSPLQNNAPINKSHSPDRAFSNKEMTFENALGPQKSRTRSHSHGEHKSPDRNYSHRNKRKKFTRHS